MYARRPTRRPGFAGIALFSFLLCPARALAQPAADPAEVTGVEEPAHQGTEPARTLANAMLWPFRLVVDLVFLATGAAGALLENEQVVPRARDFFFTRGGELGIFP